MPRPDYAITRIPDGTTSSEARRLILKSQLCVVDDPEARAVRRFFGRSEAWLARAYLIRYEEIAAGHRGRWGDTWRQMMREARRQRRWAPPLLVSELRSDCLHYHRQSPNRNQTLVWCPGDIEEVTTPPWARLCASCGRFCYITDTRRTLCNACRLKNERDKKRQQRGTDLSERLCPICSTAFTPKRSDARCCSAKCRAKLSRTMQKNTASQPPGGRTDQQQAD